ncbi:hypothetical protein XENTR_v10005111 [Xenopus tropicalis]|nr:hypothetical protein XENTR_v10005111 [Xenopus tropicalis]
MDPMTPVLIEQPSPFSQWFMLSLFFRIYIIQYGVSLIVFLLWHGSSTFHVVWQICSEGRLFSYLMLTIH